MTGGIALVLLYGVFIRIGEGALLFKCIVGAILITSLEFISGSIVNVGLKLNVWDYSHKRYQLYGQVCLTYSILWGLLCLPVALLVQAIHDVWG